jgi:UDP-N-acetylmuramoyl-L-alanyl-D-glutamate--2,6-diaminopimelate ligase
VTSRIPPVLRPEHPAPRSLAILVREFGLEYRGSVDGVEVTGVTLGTSDLHPGDLFVGIQGANSHGARYATQAKQGGAVALVTDAAGAELAADSGLPIVIVDDPRGALGELSAWVYRTAESSASARPGRTARPPPPTCWKPSCGSSDWSPG